MGYYYGLFNSKYLEYKMNLFTKQDINKLYNKYIIFLKI